MKTGSTRCFISSPGQLADKVVTTEKIDDLAVDEYKINDAAIYPIHLSDIIKSSRAHAYRSTDQSYSANTNTKVQFDKKSFDLAYQYDDTTNFRFTVASGYAGQHVVHAQLTIAGRSTAGNIIVRIMMNGSVRQESRRAYSGDSVNFTVDALIVLDLVEGDYLEIAVYDSQAGTIKGGPGMSYFEVYRLP
jgi:hypothetical protein